MAPLPVVVAKVPAEYIKDKDQYRGMLKANMAMKQRDYTTAFSIYEKVYTGFPDDILADDALFKAALLQENYLNQPEKAKELYEKLIITYKGSVYAVEASAKFRKLRGDVLTQ